VHAHMRTSETRERWGKPPAKPSQLKGWLHQTTQLKTLTWQELKVTSRLNDGVL